jgi:iron complex transport system substrate-binding protein
VPARIVSLSPAVTEIVYALGRGGNVAGVTSHCFYPPDAAQKTKVGDWLNTNPEAVVALKPDLVIVSSMESALADHLKGLGLRCLVVKQDSVADILQSIADIGAACAAPEQARALTKSIRDHLHRIETLVAGGARPRVMVSVGRDYTSKAMDQVYIAGKDCFYSELVRIAGGENVFQEEGFPYPAVSGEGIMQLNPDVILDIVPERDAQRLDDRGLLAAWKSLPEVTAVRNGHIYVLDGDYIAVPGPRLVRALDDIARMLHPEAKL